MQSTDEEIWKDINFTQGRYEISSKGRVRRKSFDIIKSNGYVQHLKSMLMKFYEDPDGYLTVGFCCKDINLYKTCMVHRLVATAFIPNPDNKPTVNHIDGNKKNNCIDNLEWATYQEQSDHAHRIGLRPHSIYENRESVKKRLSKPVYCVETNETFHSMTEAESKLHLYGGCVSICIATGRPVRGLHFKRL